MVITMVYYCSTAMIAVEDRIFLKNSHISSIGMRKCTYIYISSVVESVAHLCNLLWNTQSYLILLLIFCRSRHPYRVASNISFVQSLFFRMLRRSHQIW